MPITVSSPILKSSAYFVIFRENGVHVPNEIKATIPLNENSQDYYLIETDINQDTDYALIVDTPFPDRYTLESIENIQEQPGNFTFLLCDFYTNSRYEENKDKWTSNDFSSGPIIVEGNPASMLEQPVIYRVALKASGGHMHNKGARISTISEQGFAVKFLKDTSYIMQDITLSAGAGDSVPVKGGAIEIVDSLKRFTDKEKRLSKYAACEYLNVSRATFDNYVREGKLPRGKHEVGFKELSWDMKTLDEFINKMRRK